MLQRDQDTSTHLTDAADIRDIARFYKISRQIGSGSYAHVKKATHRQTAAKVAVKIYTKRQMKHDDIMQAIQEARTLKKLKQCH